MAEDLMRYDQMAREALRGVVRAALRRAADEGLPGSHHFYISFQTRAPGVDLDPELMDKHPVEMTIVLEHQYWDLAVDEDAFEVTLKFNRIPKYIRIPFDAVVQFHDPSVGFTLRFDPTQDAQGQDAKGQDAQAGARGGVKPAPEAALLAPRAAPPGTRAARTARGGGGGGGDAAKPAPRLKVKPEEPPPNGQGGQVVDIEKFRKKSD
jgi:hypothetical protein